jgi:hypothetical protein
MKTTDTLSGKMMHILYSGKDRLGGEAVGRIRQYIASQMTEQAFFVNRNGEEDIYYTAFGWMLSHVFDVRIPRRQARLRLKNEPMETGDLIRYAACIRATLLLDMLAGNYVRLLVNLYRKAGMPEFNLFPHNDSRSPYSRFIRLSLMEDMKRKIKDGKEIIESLNAYKVRSSGGYSNIAGGLSASTNATSAALSVKGQLEGYGINEDVDYLYNFQGDSGGFSASGDAPLPDILSTATALFVLRCHGVTPRIGPDPFIEAHWLESGGFAPTLFEENSDIEYTFYGLLALGTC